MTWSHRYRYCGTRQGLATHYVQSFMSKAFFRTISVYMFFRPGRYKQAISTTKGAMSLRRCCHTRKIHDPRSGPTTGRKEFPTGRARALYAGRPCGSHSARHRLRTPPSYGRRVASKSALSKSHAGNPSDRTVSLVSAGITPSPPDG